MKSRSKAPASDSVEPVGEAPASSDSGARAVPAARREGRPSQATRTWIMDIDHLRQIMSLVREHELSEFEIEQEGLRLKIRKDAPALATPVLQSPVQPAAMAAAAAPAGGTAPVPAPSVATPGEVGDAEIELAVVKSPIVGTFYRSAEPSAPVFVEIGSTVKKGQVLCIIEAMKLMNEIDSEYDGEIVNVYVENGQPVQYGERLFAIRTR